ncbi:hypothetical protein FPQ18DRAFT_305574 [Pyronema domesticum]|nr:hypothetical protein FPQ18DRAFT_305574 [Pyronema domesticum]
MADALNLHVSIRKKKHSPDSGSEFSKSEKKKPVAKAKLNDHSDCGCHSYRYFLVENGVTGIDSHQEFLTEWKMVGKSVTLIAITEDSYTCCFRLILTFAGNWVYHEEVNFLRHGDAYWYAWKPCGQQRTRSLVGIEGLKRMGVFVWMLSGDNTITAQAVARQIVIPETNVLTGLLPTEKADKIEYL